jgi:hypothetical protein
MSQKRSFRRTFVGLAATCALCACGGQGDDFAPASSNSPSDSVPPLLDDEGESMPSAVRPSDAGAWTTNGRYATAAQARQLARSLGDELLQVEVECCGEAAVDTAAGIVWALQAAQNPPSARTYVLVQGRDERLAAATIDRLLQGGLRDVWLVTAAHD